MPKMNLLNLHNHDAGLEPAPAFPTDAEVKLAQQLRYQLEQRYLALDAPKTGTTSAANCETLPSFLSASG